MGKMQRRRGSSLLFRLSQYVARLSAGGAGASLTPLTLSFPIQLLLELDAEAWPCLGRWADAQGAVCAGPVEEDIGTACGPLHECAADRRTVAYDAMGVDTYTVKEALRLFSAPALPGVPTRYLKDCHIALHHREAAAAAYSTPVAFQEDYLNWWWSGAVGSLLAAACESGAAAAWGVPGDVVRSLVRETPAMAGAIPAGQDDYKFLYLGQAGSFTPIHHDIIASHSWSAQIAGRKLWLLWEPAATQHLADGDGIPLIADATLDLDPKAIQGLPEHLREALLLAAAAHSEHEGGATQPSVSVPWQRCWAAVQAPGTAMFVPSGWFHQVLNLDMCLSINHNWFGTEALPAITAFLLATSRRVQQRIQDCRTAGVAEEARDAAWLFLVERMLRADVGMHLQQWTWLLTAIALSLLQGAVAGHAETQAGPTPPGRETHTLQALQRCLAQLQEGAPLIQALQLAQGDAALADACRREGLVPLWVLPALLAKLQTALPLPK